MRYFFLLTITLLLIAPACVADPLGDYHNSLDRSCVTDADCVVKDIGNCCGYYPGCLNKDAATDPAKVQASCGDMMGACGFPDIQSCSCVQGACQPAATSGAVDR